jgi:hypothetical protein
LHEGWQKSFVQCNKDQRTAHADVTIVEAGTCPRKDKKTDLRSQIGFLFISTFLKGVIIQKTFYTQIVKVSARKKRTKTPTTF